MPPQIAATPLSISRSGSMRTAPLGALTSCSTPSRSITRTVGMPAPVAQRRVSLPTAPPGRQPLLLAERPEQLDDAGGLLPMAQRAAQLTRQQRHDLLVVTKDLRAHIVGNDAQTAVGLQALDQGMDRCAKLLLQRIEADLHADVHETLTIEQSVQS